MSESTVVELDAVEIVQRFVDACTGGDPEPAAPLLHPQIHYRALIANGSYMEERSRDAVIREVREFIASFGEPEVLQQSLEPIGPYVCWSTRWRMQKDGAANLFEWYAFLKVEEGRITRFDEICTGRVPESG